MNLRLNTFAGRLLNFVVYCVLVDVRCLRVVVRLLVVVCWLLVVVGWFGASCLWCLSCQCGG